MMASSSDKDEDRRSVREAREEAVAKEGVPDAKESKRKRRRHEKKKGKTPGEESKVEKPKEDEMEEVEVEEPVKSSKPPVRSPPVVPPKVKKDHLKDKVEKGKKGKGKGEKGKGKGKGKSRSCKPKRKLQAHRSRNVLRNLLPHHQDMPLLKDQSHGMCWLEWEEVPPSPSLTYQGPDSPKVRHIAYDVTSAASVVTLQGSALRSIFELA